MTLLGPALALLLAAAIWGGTFPLVKDALHDIGPFEFLALRFGMSTIAYVLLWPRLARKALHIGLGAGLVTGALLAAGHGFQTAGIEFTRATNAGFITGLYVVFTPLLAAAFLRKRPSPLVMFGVLLTTIGLALMSLEVTHGGISMNAGDVLVLCCAVAYAGQIVAVARWAPGMDFRILTLQQFAVTFVVFALLTPIEEVRAPTTSAVWIALIATAIGSSVYGIGVQTWAQQRMPPTSAALIYSMEAPFAAIAAYFLADERLPSRAWAGAALILVGMLIVQIRAAAAIKEVQANPAASRVGSSSTTTGRE